jgi:TPR repeat protein
MKLLWCAIILGFVISAEVKTNGIVLHQPLLTQEASAREFSMCGPDLWDSELPALEDKALIGSPGAAVTLSGYYSCLPHSNSEKRLFWTEIGAENGDHLAQNKIALLMERGEMGDRNRARAKFWAKKGKVDSVAEYWNRQYKTGGSSSAKPQLEQSGRAEIVEKDLTESEIRKLEAEALGGSPESALRLFLFYEHFRADPAESFYWARISAQNDDPTGQFELGVMLSGDADPKSRKRAAFWLKKAAERGNTTAEALLKDLSDK